MSRKTGSTTTPLLDDSLGIDPLLVINVPEGRTVASAGLRMSHYQAPAVAGNFGAFLQLATAPLTRSVGQLPGRQPERLDCVVGDRRE